MHERERRTKGPPSPDGSHAARNLRLTRHRFFLGYAYDILTHTSLWTRLRDLLAYVRRARTVALVLRILSLALTALQTGALVLLATALTVVVLPVAVATMLAILLTARLESRRTNRLLLHETQGRRVCVLFLAANAPTAFLFANARDLADRGYTVLLISPYLLSPRGMSRGRFYCTARAEAEHVYLVRRYYFFSLRKHVITAREAVYVY